MTARARLVLLLVLPFLIPAHAASAQGGFGGFGRFNQQPVRLIPQFDKDADGRLNATERAAARAYLDMQRNGRRPYRRPDITPGRKVTPAELKPPYPGTSLYDADTLRTIFLEFEDADWEQQMSTFFNTDVEMPATVTVDGKTYPEVGVHFRGNSSFRMVPEGLKRSLNLSFDYVHPKQALLGYKTLNLLNSHEDPTYLHTVLSQEIARDYLPASRSNYVRVVINGENWGVYVNNEQFNKRFLTEWFPSGDGTRWKVPGQPRARGGLEYWGDDPAQYKRIFEIKTKDTPKAWADLVQLCRLLNETPPEKLEAALAPVLDIDQALRFLAVDMALNNGDGYWTRASDYEIYEDPKGRFHILPGDMNETFADGGRGFGFGGVPPSPELDPLAGLTDPSKPLRTKLLAVPALRTKYLAYVRQIAEKWLDWKKIGPLAERYQQLIASEVRADTRKLDGFEEFPADLPGQGDFRSFVERRRAYLLAYQPDPAPRPRQAAALR